MFDNARLGLPTFDAPVQTQTRKVTDVYRRWGSLALIAAFTTTCFGLDHEWGKGPLWPGFFSWWAYLLATLGIIAFAISLSPFGNNSLKLFLAGMLFAAGTGAMLIGMLLLPLTIIGIVVLIGVLGLIPFFVAFVIFKQARWIYSNAASDTFRIGEATVLTLGALAVACPVWFAFSFERGWFEHRYQALTAPKPIEIASASKELGANPMCRTDCKLRVCASPATSQSNSEVRSALESLLGAEPDQRCQLLAD
jgi:hypothetical protein